MFDDDLGIASRLDPGASWLLVHPLNPFWGDD